MASAEPSYAPFFGIMGATASMVFCGLSDVKLIYFHCSIRCCIWYSQVRCRHLLHGRDAS